LLGLGVAIALAFTSSSCVRESFLVDPTQVLTPVTVRGYNSLSLTLDVRNATGVITDSVFFFAGIVHVTTAVSGYSSGSCRITISNRSHVSIATDSLGGNAEIINRKITGEMPLHLRVYLQGFTGKLTCMILDTPFEAMGLDARFSLRDSMGSERDSFSIGEIIDFTYAFYNKSSTEQEWAQGTHLPFGRFTVMRGDSLVMDSFGGKGWLPEGNGGILLPGDSLHAFWRGVYSAHPLSPGHYVAKVEATFRLKLYGWPTPIEKPFIVSQ